MTMSLTDQNFDFECKFPNKLSDIRSFLYITEWLVVSLLYFSKDLKLERTQFN